MPRRNNEAEETAARNVQRVLGGTWELHDTGTDDGQFDVLLTLSDGREVALEHTSHGGGLWRRTRARLRRAREHGKLAGNTLSKQWLILLTTGTGIRELEPDLEAALRSLEQGGHDQVSARYQGVDATLTGVAARFGPLGVRSAVVFDAEPNDNEPRILLAQADSSVGGAGALPSALAEVFSKEDNQAKLAAADVAERHLYVFMEDGDAGAVLDGALVLPDCPADPHGVIDVVWVYTPSSSAYLFAAKPGRSGWTRYVSLTGSRAE